MTDPALTTRTPRLNQLVAKPGGLTAEQAVSRAELNLDGIRDQGLAAVDVAVTKMLAIVARGEPDLAGRDDLYRLSNSLVGVAGAFGLVDVSAAAYSLCELLDKLAETQRWNAKAVEVHLSSLKLLRSPGAGSDAASRADIMRGLRQVAGATA